MAKFRSGKQIECLICGDKAYLAYNESFVRNDKTCNCNGPRKVRMIPNHPDHGACENVERKTIKKPRKS